MHAEPSRSRRAAVASLPSLLAIVASFFMPFVRGCDRMVYPAEFLRPPLNVGMVWVLPRFFAALLLVVLAAVALRQGTPSRRVLRLAAIGVAAQVPGTLIMIWDLVHDLRNVNLGMVLIASPMIALTVLGIWFAVTAWRRPEPWTRWWRLVAAYTSLASPLALLVMTAACDGLKEVGVGGWCYLAAIVTLLGLAIAARERSAAS